MHKLVLLTAWTDLRGLIDDARTTVFQSTTMEKIINYLKEEGYEYSDKMDTWSKYDEMEEKQYVALIHKI